jgi:fibronectin type 3 domain-containing protein
LTYHLFKEEALLWSGASTAYNDTSVTNEVTYSYIVVAENDVGWGTGISVSATPAIVPVPPGIPIGLQAIKDDGQVTLTWDAPSQSGSSAITGYKVYRGPTAGTATLIASVIDTTYVDTAAQEGQTYYYKVSAVNADGESTLTEAIPVFLTPPPSPVDYTWLIIAGVVGSIVLIGAAWFILSRKK